MASQSESLGPSNQDISYNQRLNKEIRERQEKGIDRKASKAERRRMEDEQFVRRFT